ncbi:hypothetical protein UM93_04185 [Psychromicrobium lacuslunae]|uniref:Uncharacterized protein n=1 Tax=Psychromicrobium lacuslunae TaxID=1618207 RepID=A0A0D4BXR3_9MICC|nr:hypothetical protein UM93_04185 [Psychromicrobium lacuslunae]
MINSLAFGSFSWDVVIEGGDDLGDLQRELDGAIAIGIEYSDYLDYLDLGEVPPFLLADLETRGNQVVKEVLESFDWPQGEVLDSVLKSEFERMLAPLLKWFR